MPRMTVLAWLDQFVPLCAEQASGDIDADGHDELVVAVSYFFDREYYDDAVRPAVDSPFFPRMLGATSCSAAVQQCINLQVDVATRKLSTLNTSSADI